MAAKVWSRVGGDPNWSNGANWNGGTVPATTDTITFDGTSVLDCTIDNLGTWSGGTFTVASTYNPGVITQNVAMVTAAWTNAETGTLGQGGYIQNANLTTTTFSHGPSAIIGTAIHQIVSGNFQCTTFAIDGNFDASGAGTFLVTGAANFQTTVGTATHHLKMSPGTMEFRGSMTVVAGGLMTMDANGGTVLFSLGTSVSIDCPASTGWAFFKCSLNKTAGTLTIAAGTTCPFGASPTMTTAGALTVTGTLTASGTITFLGGSTLTVSAGGVMSGFTTLNLQNSDFTVNATGTIPTGLILIIPATGTSAQTITATTATFGTSTSIAHTGGFTIAAGTSIPFASGSSFSALTITGTITCPSGAAITVDGLLTVSATGVMNGSAAYEIINSNLATNAAATINNAPSIIMNVGAGARTFGGGGKTYGTLRRTSSGAGSLTITGTNVFGAIVDNLGLVAHTITFPNVSTSVGYFAVAGSAGKLVTLARTGGAGTFTLTKPTAGNVVQVDYISVSNSTVDASPLWYAGSHSTDGGGNTNWIFTAPVTYPKRRKAAYMVG